ncbi:hypothetical protein EXIGLDRAFT_695759 [Exidia glandulosa HHB12029]|uniref:Uncharacterized protein n=1 Tax=Exidia glandulosa HHB12029 TaxID=1314781 RepID=A0A165FNN6_EXIGL|nr:hypothetical protein EXIGLDRAFT_695759 [Exidia glandulosa HHB12029]
MIMLSSNIALHVLFALELLPTVTADPYLVIAYDGSSAKLGNYSPREHERSMSKRLDGVSSGCFNITGADIQTLPGWSTLSSIAVDSWGTGWFTISTNDPVNEFETLAGPTNACVSSVAQIVYDGQPICNSTTHNSTDHVSGMGSNITLQAIEFKSASTQNSGPARREFRLDLNFDAVNFGTGLPTTQSLTIANTPDTRQAHLRHEADRRIDLGSSCRSTHFNVTQQQEKPVTFTGKAGQDCNLRYTEQTCAVNGHVLWKDGLDSFDSDWTASAPSIRRRSRP